MKSNFAFLETKWPLLASIGSLAEKYIYTDSNSCFIKLGMFGESIVHLIFTLDQIEEPQADNTHANRIRILKKEGLLPKDIDDIFYALRTSRNKAAHDGYESADKAEILIQFAYKLGIWFMQTYGEWDYEPAAFVMPQAGVLLDNNQVETERQEKIIRELANDIKKTSQKDGMPINDRIKRGHSSAEKLNLSEQETRYLIDAQLRKVGWEADTLGLRYGNGIRPQKAKTWRLPNGRPVRRWVATVILIMPCLLAIGWWVL